MSDAPTTPSAIIATVCLVDASGRQLHVQAPTNAAHIDVGPLIQDGKGGGIGCLRFERTDDIDPLTLEHIYRQKI